MIIGEVDNSMAEQLIKNSMVGSAFTESYAKCECKRCGQKFKYKTDSAEMFFATCPTCGFSNNYEEH